MQQPTNPMQKEEWEVQFEEFSIGKAWEAEQQEFVLLHEPKEIKSFISTQISLAKSQERERIVEIAEGMMKGLHTKRMNREIKFRAWDKKNGMTPVGEIDFTGNSSTNDREIHIMQFTGLLDKNGKEIYEGDMVKGNRTYEIKNEQEIVRWDNELCGFLPFAEYDSDCSVYFQTKDCEIIGNIYENPELLTQKE